MRIPLYLTWAGGLLLAVASWARADDQAEVLAVLDKAIQACGGEAKLAQLKAATWTSKGAARSPAGPLTVTEQVAMQLPGQMRVESEVVAGGQKIKQVVVLNGDQGWVKQNDKTEAMRKEMLAEMKESFYVAQVAHTLVPLKGKEFRLVPLGAKTIAGRAAVGVTVRHLDHRDLNLYFDKENGLLLATTTRHKDLQSGQEYSQETHFSNYKEFDGLRLPTKTTIFRDGKPFGEAEVSDLKVRDKVDQGQFGKP
jgi:hypothetical protein